MISRHSWWGKTEKWLKWQRRSVTENGKEGKSKMIASCGFLENEPSQFSKEEGVTLWKRWALT